MLLFRLGAGPLPDPEGCTAEVGGRRGRADHRAGRERLAHRRDRAYGAGCRPGPRRSRWPPPSRRASCENLDYGDRDSLGLFQQRPSQGWGTAEQISDPVYATNAFYDALVEVDGYQDMRITEAAQEVQRSGFPEAYEEHAEGARALASALTGYSPRPVQLRGAATATLDAEEPGAARADPAGRARCARPGAASSGDLSLGGFAPGGVTTGHMEGSAHYEGRAVDVFVRPVDDGEPAARAGRSRSTSSPTPSGSASTTSSSTTGSGRAGRRSEEGWRDYDAPVDGVDRRGDPRRSSSTATTCTSTWSRAAESGTSDPIRHRPAPPPRSGTRRSPTLLSVGWGARRGTPGSGRQAEEQTWASTSMMYTMGMALDRAAEAGHGASASWSRGRGSTVSIAAVDGMGVVLESDDGDHTVIRVDRVAAVKVHAESPFRTSIARGTAAAPEARPMPGPRTA